MLTCGDFFGALQSILNNDINPLVTTEAVLFFPPLGVAALLMAVLFSLMACFQ